MGTVFIGIGTNIGDKSKNIDSAVDSLNHLPGTHVVKVSSVYETAPWGYLEQDNFYNVCACVETRLSPNAFLGACLGIEAAFGRERPFKNSPRIIDIDVLLYDDMRINTAELTVPHPRMHERGFVLVPLTDVLPELSVGDIDLNEAYIKCDKSGVKKCFNISQEIF